MKKIVRILSIILCCIVLGAFGFCTYVASRVTQDKEVGIGNWADSELLHYLRTGVRHNGTYAPIMPKFPLMADEDFESVVT